MLESDYIILASAILSPLATLIIGKYLLNHAKNTVKDELFDFIDSKDFDSLLISLLNRETLQKFLYSVGGLIGSGARSGIGLGKKGGKLGLQDLLMTLAGKYLGLGTESETREGSSPLTNLKP